MAPHTPGTAQGSETFSPVSVGRASQVIIDQVKLLIRDGRLQQGDRHNPAIAMLVQSFHGPMLMSLAESHQRAPMGSRGIQEHRQLARAIQDRDLSRAREVATSHLDRTARRVRHDEEPGDHDTVR
jgi:hypothetical protein